MEVPAIGLAVALARRGEGKTQGGPLVLEVLLNRSIFLLIGGVAIGAVAGHERLQPIEGFSFGGFKGALALFLLEMGVLASQRLGDLKKVGTFLVGFGILMPLLAGTLGALAGTLAGLSLGGTTLPAILAASASYIAAPAVETSADQFRKGSIAEVNPPESESLRRSTGPNPPNAAGAPGPPVVRPSREPPRSRPERPPRPRPRPPGRPDTACRPPSP